MRHRLALAGLILPAFLASTAVAAPRIYCKVLNDGDNDANKPQDAATPGSGGDIEVLDGDIATDARNLTVTIRLADLTPPDPVNAVQGKFWNFHFSVDRLHNYSLRATYGGSDAGYEFWREPQGYAPMGGEPRSTPDGRPVLLGPATGVQDEVRNEVRMTVPLTAFPPTGVTLRKGHLLYNYGVETNRTVGDFKGSPLPSSVDLGPGTAHWWATPITAADMASSNKAMYPVGARSCALVGR